MPAESGFFFLVATVSASLAGLAGLVAALRRGSGLGVLDLYRLREIVEFAFATILLSVSTVPLAGILGLDGAVRLIGGMAILLLVGHAILLARRALAREIRRYPAWAAVAVALDLLAGGAAAIALLTGSVPVYQLLLVALVARPMAAFLLVLSQFESS